MSCKYLFGDKWYSEKEIIEIQDSLYNPNVPSLIERDIYENIQTIIKNNDILNSNVSNHVYDLLTNETKEVLKKDNVTKDNFRDRFNNELSKKRKKSWFQKVLDELRRLFFHNRLGEIVRSIEKQKISSYFNDKGSMAIYGITKNQKNSRIPLLNYSLYRSRYPFKYNLKNILSKGIKFIVAGKNFDEFKSIVDKIRPEYTRAISLDQYNKRDDAWRISNGLPQINNTFVYIGTNKNGEEVYDFLTPDFNLKDLNTLTGTDKSNLIEGEYAIKTGIDNLGHYTEYSDKFDLDIAPIQKVTTTENPFFIQGKVYKALSYDNNGEPFAYYTKDISDKNILEYSRFINNINFNEGNYPETKFFSLNFEDRYEVSEIEKTGLLIEGVPPMYTKEVYNNLKTNIIENIKDKESLTASEFRVIFKEESQKLKDAYADYVKYMEDGFDEPVQYERFKFIIDEHIKKWEVVEYGAFNIIRQYLDGVTESSILDQEVLKQADNEKKNFDDTATYSKDNFKSSSSRLKFFLENIPKKRNKKEERIDYVYNLMEDYVYDRDSDLVNGKDSIDFTIEHKDGTTTDVNLKHASTIQEGENIVMPITKNHLKRDENLLNSAIELFGDIDYASIQGYGDSLLLFTDKEDTPLIKSTYDVDYVFAKLQALLRISNDNHYELNLDNVKEIIDKSDLNFKDSLLEVLEEAPTEIINEFLSTMYMEYLEMYSINMLNTRDGLKTIIRNDNQSSIYNSIESNLFNNLMNSDIVTDGRFNENTEEFLNRTKGEYDVRQFFEDLGLNISDEVIDLLNNGQFYHLRTKWSKKDLYSEKQGLIGIIRKTIRAHRKNNKNLYEDSFIKQGVFKSLIRHEMNFVKDVMSDSTRVGGKVIWGSTQINFFKQRFNKLKFSEKGTGIIDQLKKIPFSKNASWLDFFDNYSYLMKTYIPSLDAIKQIGSRNKNEDLSSKGEIDHIWSKLVYFLNNAATVKIGDFDSRISRFLYFTMSDRKHPRVVEAPSGTIRITSDQIIYSDINNPYGTDALDYIIDQTVVPEILRMYEASNSDLDGYEPNYFYLIPELNDKNILKLFFHISGDEKVLKNKEDIFASIVENRPIKLQNNILKKLRVVLKDRINKRINETSEKWKKSGIFKKRGTQYRFIPADYKNWVINNGYATNDTFEKYVATDYYINYLIAHANMHMTISQDPALFYKKPKKIEGRPTTFMDHIKATYANIYKRLAGDSGPGMAGNFKEKFYNVLYMNDPRSVSKNIIQLAKVLDGIDVTEQEVQNYKDNVEKYNDKTLSTYDRDKLDKKIKNFKSKFKNSSDFLSIDMADAQEFTTWREHLTVMQAYGKLSDETFNNLWKTFKRQETELKKLGYIKTKVDRRLLSTVLQPMKPLQVGTIIKGNIEKRYYIKSSSFPLIPELTVNTELDKLRETMNNNRIDRAVFGTTTKLGYPKSRADIFNNDGTLNKVDSLPEGSFEALPREYFKIQQEVPQKNKTVVGTQESNLMFVNFLNLSGFFFQGEEYTGEKLREVWNETWKNAYDYKYSQFLRELSKEGEEPSIENIDPVKLVDIIKDEMKRRNYSINDQLGIFLDENGVLDIPLWSLSNYSGIEALLVSIVTNRLMPNKTTGHSSVLATEAGMISSKDKKVLEGKEAEEFIESVPGIIFTPSWNPKEGLQPMRVEDGKIKGSQVIVPWKFKQKIENYITDGKLDLSKVDPEVLESFGFRIPTQLHNSMVFIEIVGFFPEKSGDIVIASQDLVAQMGSDFDVDKLYKYLFNVQDVDGKLKKLEILNFILEDELLKIIGPSNKDSLPTVLKDRKKTTIQQLIEEYGVSESFKMINDIVQEFIEELNNQVLQGTEFQIEIPKEAMTVDNIEEITDALENIQLQEIEKNEYIPKIKALKKILNSFGNIEKDFQNKLLEIRLSIFKNKNQIVQRQIFYPENLGSLASNIIEQYENHDLALEIPNSLLDPDYQVKKYMEARSAAIGIGSTSKDSVHNALIQGKDMHYNITNVANPIVVNGKSPVVINKKIIKDDKEINLVFADFSSQYTIDSFNEIKQKIEELENVSLNTDIEKDRNYILNYDISKLDLNISDIEFKSITFRFYQTLSVDNASENLMYAGNVNTNTFPVIRSMSQLGYDNRDIQSIIGQESIRKISSGLDNINAITNDFDINAQESVIESVEDFYIKEYKNLLGIMPKELSGIIMTLRMSNIENVEEVGLKSFWDASKVTGENVKTNRDLYKRWLEFQIKSISLFRDFHEMGIEINAHQSRSSFYKPDHFGKDISYNIIKKQDNDRLDIDIKIENADKIMDGTLGLNRSYVSGTILEVFSKYFPYASSTFSDIIKNIRKNMNSETIDRVDKNIENRNEFQREVFRYLRSYLFLSNLKQDNREGLYIGNEERQPLHYYIEKIKDGDTNVENKFIDLATITNYDGVKIIGFDTSGMKPIDDAYIFSSFNDLYSTEIEIEDGYTTRDLYTDLIETAFLKGGNQMSNDYVTYINILYLKSQEDGFYNGTKDFQQSFINGDQLTGFNTDIFVESFLQHFPEYANQVSTTGLTYEGNTIDAKVFKINENTPMLMGPEESYPQYLAMSVRKSEKSPYSNKLLLKKQGEVYVRIDNLGYTRSILEAPVNNISKSVFKVNKGIEGEIKPMKGTTPIKEDIKIPKNLNIKDILESIVKTNKSDDISAIANSYLILLDNMDLKDLKVRYENNGKDSEPAYYEQNENVIIINKDVVDPNDEYFQELFLHEITHSFLSRVITFYQNNINNPDILDKVPEITKQLQRLNNTRQKSIKYAIKKGLTTKEIIDKWENIAKLPNKQREDRIKEENKRMSALEEKEKSREKWGYMHMNLHEFTSFVMSNLDLQKELKKQKGVVDEIVDVITRLLKRVGFKLENNVLSESIYNILFITEKFNIRVPSPQKVIKDEGKFYQTSYRGIKIEDRTDIINNEGKPGAAQYDRKNNIIKINRDLLKQKYQDKSWTNMRSLVEEIDGIKEVSQAENLPEDQFKNYLDFEKFVIEHEYQHSLLSRKDFDDSKPWKTTRGEYETEINRRALEELKQPTTQPQVGVRKEKYEFGDIVSYKGREYLVRKTNESKKVQLTDFNNEKNLSGTPLADKLEFIRKSEVRTDRSGNKYVMLKNRKNENSVYSVNKITKFSEEDFLRFQIKDGDLRKEEYNHGGDIYELYFNENNELRKIIHPSSLQRDKNVGIELFNIIKKDYFSKKQSTPISKTVVVPEGSNPKNKVIFEDEYNIYLMNDGQQEAYEKIKEIILNKLEDTERVVVSDDKVTFDNQLNSAYNGIIPSSMWDRMVGLIGKGGTGKTTLVKKIIEDISSEMQDKNKDNDYYSSLSVQFIAPTHKATTVLQESLGRDSESASSDNISTISSFLYRRPADEIGEKFKIIDEKTYLNKINQGIRPPISTKNIIVIDEASMFSKQDLKDLEERLKSEEEKLGYSGIPVILFLGDYRQLVPIEDFDGFKLGLISSTVFSDKSKSAELSEIMRSEDIALHRLSDSIGDQIDSFKNTLINSKFESAEEFTEQKEDVLTFKEKQAKLLEQLNKSVEENQKKGVPSNFNFNWEKVDNASKISQENLLIIDENQIDGLINKYAERLKEDRTDHIYWIHYNNVKHNNTKPLIKKIRKEYLFKDSEYTEEIVSGDYLQYNGSTTERTDSDNSRDIQIGLIKPKSRIKVKEILKNETYQIKIGTEFYELKATKIVYLNRQGRTRSIKMINEEFSYSKDGYKNGNQKFRIGDNEFILPYGQFLNIKEIFANRAYKKLNFSYVGSADSAQGDAVDTVIVGEYNFKRQPVEKVNRLRAITGLYTAITRARKAVIMVKPIGKAADKNNDTKIFKYFSDSKIKYSILDFQNYKKNFEINSKKEIDIILNSIVMSDTVSNKEILDFARREIDKELSRLSKDDLILKAYTLNETKRVKLEKIKERAIVENFDFDYTIEEYTEMKQKRDFILSNLQANSFLTDSMEDMESFDDLDPNLQEYIKEYVEDFRLYAINFRGSNIPVENASYEGIINNMIEFVNKRQATLNNIQIKIDSDSKKGKNVKKLEEKAVLLKEEIKKAEFSIVEMSTFKKNSDIYKYALSRLEEIDSAIDAGNMSHSDLLYFISMSKYFVEMLEISEENVLYSASDIFSWKTDETSHIHDFKQLQDKFSTKTDILSTYLKDVVLNLSRENLQDEEITTESLLKKMEDIGFFEKYTLEPGSAIDSEIIQLLTKIIADTVNSATLDTKEMMDPINNLINKAMPILESIRQKEGYEDLNDPFIQKYKDGELTGDMVDYYTPEYNEEYNSKRADLKRAINNSDKLKSKATTEEEYRYAENYLTNEYKKFNKFKKDNHIILDPRKIIYDSELLYEGDSLKGISDSEAKSLYENHKKEIISNYGINKKRFDSLEAELKQNVDKFKEEFNAFKRVLDKDLEDLKITEVQYTRELKIFNRRYNPYYAALASESIMTSWEDVPGATIYSNHKYSKFIPIPKWHDNKMKVIYENEVLYELHSKIKELNKAVIDFTPPHLRDKIKENSLFEMEKLLVEKLGSNSILSKISGSATHAYNEFLKTIRFTAEQEDSNRFRTPKTSYLASSSKKINDLTKVKFQIFRSNASKMSESELIDFIKNNYSSFLWSKVEGLNFKTQRNKVFGEVKKEIKRILTSENAREKSFNLGRVVNTFALLANEYKNRSFYVDSISLIENLIKDTYTGIFSKGRIKSSASSYLPKSLGFTKSEFKKNITTGEEEITPLLDMLRVVDFQISSVIEEKNKKITTRYFGGKVYLPQEKEMIKETNKAIKTLEEDYKSGFITEKEYLKSRQEFESFIDSMGNRKSLSSILRFGQIYTQLRSLGWNPMIFFTNRTFGASTNRDEAASGQSFNLKDYLKSKEIVEKSEKYRSSFGMHAGMALGIYFLPFSGIPIAGHVLNLLVGGYAGKKLGSMLYRITSSRKKLAEEKKLEKAMYMFDTLKVQLDVAMKSNTETYLQKKTKMFYPFYSNEASEYGNQAEILLSVLFNRQVKDKDGNITSLWDAFDDEMNLKDNYDENEIKIENIKTDKIGLKEVKLDLMAEVNRLVEKNHGNYNPYKPILLSQKPGEAGFLQFKRWAPEFFNLRIGKTVKNYHLNNSETGDSFIIQRGMFDSMIRTLKDEEDVTGENSFSTNFKKLNNISPSLLLGGTTAVGIATGTALGSFVAPLAIMGGASLVYRGVSSFSETNKWKRFNQFLRNTHLMTGSIIASQLFRNKKLEKYLYDKVYMDETLNNVDRSNTLRMSSNIANYFYFSIMASIYTSLINSLSDDDDDQDLEYLLKFLRVRHMSGANEFEQISPTEHASLLSPRSGGLYPGAQVLVNLGLLIKDAITVLSGDTTYKRGVNRGKNRIVVGIERMTPLINKPASTRYRIEEVIY